MRRRIHACHMARDAGVSAAPCRRSPLSWQGQSTVRTASSFGGRSTVGTTSSSPTTCRRSTVGNTSSSPTTSLPIIPIIICTPTHTLPRPLRADSPPPLLRSVGFNLAFLFSWGRQRGCGRGGVRVGRKGWRRVAGSGLSR